MVPSQVEMTVSDFDEPREGGGNEDFNHTLNNINTGQDLITEETSVRLRSKKNK